MHDSMGPMTRGATARLFVAVDPPVAVREELASWARDVAAALRLRAGKGTRAPLRLVAPELLHITLCFLGSRPVEEIEAIGKAVSADWTISDRSPVGEVSLGAPVWLPPRRPRTLAVEVHDDGRGALNALHDSVTRAIVAVSGWEPERRRFRAHLTVARIGGRYAAELRWAEPSLPATPQLRFTPESLVLYRSWLSPAGASYEALVTSSLAPF
jgi:2'-5' RNA ligase